MKAILTSIFLVALAVCVRAGTEQVTTTTTVAPEQLLYGVGWYGAIDMGANLHSDRGGTRVFDNEFGDVLTIEPNDDVGFYGGIKFGYVFGTGAFRPTIEGDFFYNGLRGGADSTLEVDGVVTRTRSSSSTINSGAFMSNFICRFGTGKFQPYLGAGIGIYYAESAGIDVETPRGNFETSGGGSHADFAWQIVAGADYYWSPKWSTFIEYHYLRYSNVTVETSDDRNVGQHLLGAGLRFHF